MLALLSGGIQPTVFAEENNENSGSTAAETNAGSQEQSNPEGSARETDDSTVNSSDFSSAEAAGETTENTSSSEATGNGSQEASEDNNDPNQNASDSETSGTDADAETESDAGTGNAVSNSESPEVSLVTSSLTSNSGLTIAYDQKTDIHSITDQSGNTIILFCMNNELHWPHTTLSIPTVPTYTEVPFEEFFNKNNITGETQLRLKTAIESVLYAGYPYNGSNLYEIVDNAFTMTVSDFNVLLTPPQILRSDFPDSIGNNTFTYDDRNNSEKMELLNKFMREAGNYYQSGATTPSGLTYQDLERLPFWHAVFCMINFQDDPLISYSTIYSADYFVTSSQAYSSTRDAIYTLLSNYGLKNNNFDDSNNSPLTNNLVRANVIGQVVMNEPDASSVNVLGDPQFYYHPDDQKWHTGELIVSSPYNAIYTIGFTDGISEESGKGQIKNGESFSLVSSTQPSSSAHFSLSADIMWMDPDNGLRVYAADESVIATSDGKAFQNMIGAVIHKTAISKSINLSVAETSFSFTKVWNDSGNQHGNRPLVSDFASKLTLKADGVTVTGYEPVITDNGNNTWTISYQYLPGLKSGSSYRVTEGKILGYAGSDTSAGNGGTLTNSLETISVLGTKTWDDGNNQDGKRPESITVNLLANGEKIDSTVVKAGADGSWTYSFAGLPKYKDGKEIVYTISEEALADYSTTINGYDIVNSYTPGKTSVTVSKAWEDNNNQDGKRPESIKVQLYADKAAIGDPVTLNDANNWTYIWKNLDEKNSGNEIVYTVEEVSSPEGYTVSISGNASEGFTIINQHTPAEKTTVTEDHSNSGGDTPTPSAKSADVIDSSPDTADHTDLLKNGITMILSLTAALITVAVYRKYQ